MTNENIDDLNLFIEQINKNIKDSNLTTELFQATTDFPLPNNQTLGGHILMLVVNNKNPNKNYWYNLNLKQIIPIPPNGYFSKFLPLNGAVSNYQGWYTYKYIANKTTVEFNQNDELIKIINIITNDLQWINGNTGIKLTTAPNVSDYDEYINQTEKDIDSKLDFIQNNLNFVLLQDATNTKFFRVYDKDKIFKDYLFDGTLYVASGAVSSPSTYKPLNIIPFVANTTNGVLYNSGDIIYNTIFSIETGIVSSYYNNRTNVFITPVTSELDPFNSSYALQKTINQNLNSVNTKLSTTLPVSNAIDIPCAPKALYPVNTNLITGNTNFIDLRNYGSPQVINFFLNTTSYTGFSVTVLLADDINGTNSTPITLKAELINNTSGIVQYTNALGTTHNNYAIQSDDKLVKYFLSIRLATAGTGGTGIGISRLYLENQIVNSRVEVIPPQATNTNGSNLYSKAINTNVSSIVSVANTGPNGVSSDNDSRLITDMGSPLSEAHNGNSWFVMNGSNLSSRSATITNFSTGSQIISIKNSKFIGLMTLELVVTATGSGGTLAVDFLYDNADANSVICKPFPNITASGTYTTIMFIPRNIKDIYIRYRYLGAAGTTFTTTAPRFIKGSHYGLEMYKNIIYDYSPLITNGARTQSINMLEHNYAKNISFRTNLIGTYTLKFLVSNDNVNFSALSTFDSSFDDSQTFTNVIANSPVVISLANGLMPIYAIAKYILIEVSNVTTTSTSTSSDFFLSN